MVLMNQAPHPNAAKVFLNWFLSREGQSDFQKTAGKYLDAGAEASLRTDIPKDEVPARNRLNPGIKYVPQWNADFFDMKVINKVIADALAEAAKK
jgi:ABC-type glycerol-3-phosphate transport system substrate-binding protein